MGTRAVLVEVQGRTSAAAAAEFVEGLLPEGSRRDDTVDPIPMNGGHTWIVRCVLRDATVSTALKSHADVVHVWPDSPIAPL